MVFNKRLSCIKVSYFVVNVSISAFNEVQVAANSSKTSVFLPESEVSVVDCLLLILAISYRNNSLCTFVIRSSGVFLVPILIIISTILLSQLASLMSICNFSSDSIKTNGRFVVNSLPGLLTRS